MYYLGYLIIVFIFYKVSVVVYNYLADKNEKTARYASIASSYIIGVPFFALSFWKNLQGFILYNSLFLYGLCSLNNVYYLNSYLSGKIKYSGWVSIIVIYVPIIFIILSIINSSSKTIIIIGYMSIVLLYIIHILISFKLPKK